MVFKDQNWGRKISDNTVGFITGLCLLRTRYQRCLSWIFTLPTDAWNEIQVYLEREKALIWCVVCRGFFAPKSSPSLRCREIDKHSQCLKYTRIVFSFSTWFKTQVLGMSPWMWKLQCSDHRSGCRVLYGTP